MRHLAILLCVAIVALGAVGCRTSEDAPVTTTGAAGGGPQASITSNTSALKADSAPLIDTVAAAPTVIDVPHSSVSFMVTPEVGGTFASEGLVLSIPAGAVSSDTPVQVKKLAAPFHLDAGTDATAANAAFCVGPIYDFGPAGLSFDEPVTLTLPYDETALPAGHPEDTVRLAYWNGESWIAYQGLLDVKNNTLTVQLERFEGSALGAIAVATLGGIILYTGNYIVEKLSDPERTSSDPVLQGTASQWITPKDPVVQEQAAKAVILNTSTNETKSLDDPDIAAWIADIARKKQVPALAYKNPDGTIAQGAYDKEKGSNWQKPAKYFTEGTDEGGPLHGDCTDSTNAAVSVLRAGGFRAKGVYGYPGGGDSSQAPHAWAEVLIGDNVYRMEDGYLYTPENADWHFREYENITDTSDPYYLSMWDEKGQKPYDASWWKTAESAGTYKGTWTTGIGDVPFEFTVDVESGVAGEFDYPDPKGATYSFEFTGRVLPDGRLGATGSITLSGTAGGKPFTSSTSISLDGQISGAEFAGVWQAADTGASGPVKATRR